MTDLSKNPLYNASEVPQFDKIEPAHIVPAVRQTLEDCAALLDDLETSATPSWQGVMEPLAEISRRLDRSWGPVGHLIGVKNSDELRAAYDEIQPEIVQFSLRVGQSEAIYKALRALRDSAAFDALDEAQQRAVTQKVQRSELSGIGLEGPERERFNALVQELSQLRTKFSNNALDATKSWSKVITDPAVVEGMPLAVRAAMAQSYSRAHDGNEATPEAGPWLVTLDIPVYLPILEHCRERALREECYRARVALASDGDYDNSPLIPRILEIRVEQAALLGYDNYAELSLATKMAELPQVRALLHELRDAAKPHAAKELVDVTEHARTLGFEGTLQNWDIHFYRKRLEEVRFGFTDDELRPYFPMPRVLDGLFALVNRLFGVSVKAADGDVPVWNEDVRFFRIYEGDEPIAGFYLDPYSRPADKRGGAWMAECSEREERADGTELPVAYLTCNGTPPVGDRPSLMSFMEVNTLFHEFGHGLQHMLTRVGYRAVSGINGVEWDAVELASQFMENWCYHKPTLIGMTGHVETGEPLPDELFDKISAARTYFSATFTLRQIMLGLTDITLHSEFDPTSGQSAFDLQRRISEETTLLGLIPEDRSLCTFGHIFAGGYAAGYYSYKWAEVLSADAFAAFEEVGLDDDTAVAEVGERYRETVLGLGGGRHPAQVFRDFRGRDPQTEPLLRHLGLLAS